MGHLEACELEDHVLTKTDEKALRKTPYKGAHHFVLKLKGADTASAKGAEGRCVAPSHMHD
eukprot:SAG11_NODE_5047_length_1680_cov_1.249842_2_plen_61_part_00